MSYVLSELCHGTGSELVDRAWRIVDEITATWDDAYDRTRQIVMWEPTNRLLIKALQVREQDLLSRQNSYAANSSTERNHISPNSTLAQANGIFSQAEPVTIAPSAVTMQGGSPFVDSFETEPFFGSPISSVDTMFPTMPTLCPVQTESGFSTPLQLFHSVPTRTNSDLQSLVDGFESLPSEEFAALFETIQ